MTRLSSSQSTGLGPTGVPLGSSSPANNSSMYPKEPLRPGPQLQLTLPNFAARVEYHNDAQTLTVFLRPGHKWSDGHPVTADDFVFWFDRVHMNKNLTPVVSPRFKGARIEKHSPHLFSYHFPQPMPLFVKHLAHNSSHLSAPAHFMRRYHPDFTDAKQPRSAKQWNSAYKTGAPTSKPSLTRAT